MKIKYLKNANILIYWYLVRYKWSNTETVNSPFELLLIVLFLVIFLPFQHPRQEGEPEKKPVPRLWLPWSHRAVHGHHGPPRLALFSIHLYWSLPCSCDRSLPCEQTGADTPPSQTCTAAGSIWRPRLLRGAARRCRETVKALQKQQWCSWHPAPCLSRAQRKVCSHWKCRPKFVVLIQVVGRICYYSSLRE